MPKEIEVTIVNNLILEQRSINIYHYKTRSAHMISYNNSITLPLQTTLQNDYIHLSIVAGPGNLELQTFVSLPVWLDFEFLAEGNIAVLHSANRQILKIPPGLPSWQLKLSRSPSFFEHSTCTVTVSDEPSGTP